MRHTFYATVILAAAVLSITALAPQSSQGQAPVQAPAQSPGQAPAQSPAQSPAQAPAETPPPAPTVMPPGPYNTVAIRLPAAMVDESFVAFRKQLAAIAQKKDRAALAPLVTKDFFWIPEDTDVADKTKPGIDTLAKALGLDGNDAAGWDVLAEYAGETTGMPDPQRQGVICSPGEPGYDEKAADELANATHTDASDWVYPSHEGLEVRAGPQPTAAIVDKLGLHFLRALDDDSPANAVMQSFLKVITPSGKTGYVSVDAVRAVVGPQMCYLKDAGGWKITGFLGGDPSHAN